MLTDSEEEGEIKESNRKHEDEHKEEGEAIYIIINMEIKIIVGFEKMMGL